MVFNKKVSTKIHESNKVSQFEKFIGVRTIVSRKYLKYNKELILIKILDTNKSKNIIFFKGNLILVKKFPDFFLRIYL
jgi:hypothetical protein